MLNLLEQIEADARVRLALPPGRLPAQEVPRYKDFLKTQSQRLKAMHRAGAGGREVCQARAELIDTLLRHILDPVLEHAERETKAPHPRIALVALGGYGRAELNPCSDLDIMFLHDQDSAPIARGKPHPFLTMVVEGVSYPLWDCELKVAPLVRSVEDCVGEASRNMQSKTALIEARRITGDVALFERLQAVILARCVRGQEDAYIQARIADQEARRAKHGGSATMQEPNIKNGCGGLRDYQNLLWMAYFKYRTRTLEELEERELISHPEAAQLTEAYDFLLRVRNDIHYEVNRPADVLLRMLQPTVARNLGYHDRSPVRRLEAFMREVYTRTRNIHLITRTLEQRLALLPQPDRRLPSLRQLIRQGRHRVRQQLVDGFKFVDGEISAQSSRVFRDQPRRLLRVFFYMQQRGLALHPDLAQLIRHQLSLVDAEFLADPHVHETFLEILNHRGNVAPVLRAMHEVGLLGRYLPEFEPLTCLVQHEFYHQYTADEHTLVCLEQLDRIWEGKEPPQQNYTELLQGLERPYLLYLALLLHDAGKAERSGRHAEVGAELALTVAQRLGLDGATTHNLRLLVERHLDMAVTSQRRDLDDPNVIAAFATQIQSLENLRMLILLTVADSLATSDKLWNGFKDSLLLQLYTRAHEHIAGGTGFRVAEHRQKEILAEDVRRRLPATVGDDEIAAHFSSLPPRYFRIGSGEDIAFDLTLAHLFMRRQLEEADHALVPVVSWHDRPDRGHTAVKVCTWDRHGLFTRISGALTAAGLNILGAQIFSRDDGIILDTFYVTDARTGLLPNRDARDLFEQHLTQVTSGEADLGRLLARREPAAPLYHSLEDERIPLNIRFENEVSQSDTVIDLEAEDQVGLLHNVAQAITEAGLDIALAKISTEKGAAMDSFYVHEVDGSKIQSPDRLAEIENALRHAVGSLSRG